MKFHLLFCLLLLSFCSYADSFNADFRVNGNQQAFVTSTLTFQPDFTVPRTLLCTGGHGNPNDRLTVTTQLAASYTLPNGAQSTSLRTNARNANELTASQNVNPASQLQWVSSGIYSQIRSEAANQNQVPIDPEYWAQIWDNNPPQDVLYSVRYLNPNNDIFDGTYRGSLHTFCSMSSSLAVGNQNTQLSNYYAGNQLSSSLTFNSPQTVVLRANYGLRECILAAVSIPHDRPRSVDPMLNASIARTISSDAVTVTVEDPYACAQQLSTSNPQVSTPVAPNAQVSSSFTLTNPTSKTISISSIALGQGTVFRNPHFNLPQGQIATNGNARISLTATAPANEGTYPLNITIAYATVDADCTGSRVSCTSNHTFETRVVVQDRQYSCTLSPANAKIIDGSRYPFTASCRNSANAVVDCPVLDWRTNAGAMSNPQTQTQRSPASTLTVNNPQGNFVRANGSVDNNPFSCDSTLTAESLTYTLSPELVQIDYDGRYMFNAACIDSAGEPYSCPSFTWTTDAGSMSPQQHNTSSALHVTTRNGGTFVRATSTFNGAEFFCSSSLRRIPQQPTLYCVLSPSPVSILKDSNYSFSAYCFDTQNDDRPANCPILSWSSSAGNMSPAQTPAQRQANLFPNSTLHVTSIYGTYVLAEGTSGGSDFSCIANLSPEPLSCEISPTNTNIERGGTYPFNMSCFNSAGVQVSCPQAAWDSHAGRMAPQVSSNSSVLNVTDVSGTYVRARRPNPQNFSCNSTLTNFGIGYTLNLVGGMSTDKINPAKGESFTITTTIRNPGGDASGFTNTLNVTGGLTDSRTFDTQLLTRLDTLTQQFQFTCPNTPTILNFVFKADSNNDVNETNERDNLAYTSVLCGPVLTCMDYV